jgi:hypothetical protein
VPRFVPCAVIAGSLALAPAAGAQEHPPAPAGPPAAHASGHAHGADHGAHKHHFSYLAGLSDNGAIDETAFTIGAGYRYALNDHFAIGPSVDFAFYDHEDTTLLLAALYWKPAGGLLLMAGTGVELVDYKGSSPGSSHDAHAAAAASESAHEDESKFAFRVGAGYEMHVGGVTLTPALGADFIDGHTTLVYAVAVGFGF